MEKIVVLTGAGISAESGIQTFRDAGGLWEGHDVTAVASPEGWEKDPALVLTFYNQRRRNVLEAQPNEGHRALVDLEEYFDVRIITQNVDDLHERAGSRRILHLHGELLKARSAVNPDRVLEWRKDLNLGDVDEAGHQLRPHIVWFGELVPHMEEALAWTMEADMLLIIGTSMKVYPAAGLVAYAPPATPVIYIDPNPTINNELAMTKELTVIQEPATTGVRKVVDTLLGKNT